MSHYLISTITNVINTTWNIGEQVYTTISDEVIKSINDEASKRTKKYCKKHNITKGSVVYEAYLEKQKKVVSKEYKSLAIKGGLIGLGFGFFV